MKTMLMMAAVTMFLFSQTALGSSGLALGARTEIECIATVQ